MSEQQVTYYEAMGGHAFFDDLVTVLRGGRPSYASANSTLLESDRLGDVAVAPKAG